MIIAKPNRQNTLAEKRNQGWCPGCDRYTVGQGKRCPGCGCKSKTRHLRHYPKVVKVDNIYMTRASDGSWSGEFQAIMARIA